MRRIEFIPVTGGYGERDSVLPTLFIPPAACAFKGPPDFGGKLLYPCPALADRWHWTYPFSMLLLVIYRTVSLVIHETTLPPFDLNPLSMGIRG